MSMTENEAIIREKISDFEMHYAEFDKYPQNIESDFVEAVSTLLQEIQQYRAMEERLKKIYGECDGILEVIVSGLERHENLELPSITVKSRLLTDEDVDMWDEYRAIGTVEEFKAFKLGRLCNKGFITIGQTIEEFKEEIRNKAIDEFKHKLLENIIEAMRQEIGE